MENSGGLSRGCKITAVAGNSIIHDLSQLNMWCSLQSGSETHDLTRKDVLPSPAVSAFLEARERGTPEDIAGEVSERDMRELEATRADQRDLKAVEAAQRAEVICIPPVKSPKPPAVLLLPCRYKPIFGICDSNTNYNTKGQKYCLYYGLGCTSNIKHTRFKSLPNFCHKPPLSTPAQLRNRNRMLHSQNQQLQL